jgi:hypothetical protein
MLVNPFVAQKSCLGMMTRRATKSLANPCEHTDWLYALTR